MPLPTPFHPRTAPLCYNQEWRTWSGYLAPALYAAAHEREYFAIRNAVALIDVSPLLKYEIRGPQAGDLLNRIMTRDVSRCAVGQVMYSPWCDDDGKVIDDGTIARLEDCLFRITAADPSLVWFQDCGYRMDVEVRDVSQDLAALAVQGPNARRLLAEVLSGVDLDNLKYYRLAQGSVDGFPVTITRTGYTGDLGYELWLAPRHAERLWDLLVEHGSGYGLLPTGMVALDIARIEAGLLLIETDYISARKALIPEQKSSPFDLGLGWAVSLEKERFIGRQALLKEHARGSRWKFVGLEIRWESLEEQFARVGLAPRVAGRASRQALPVYGRSIGVARQIGRTTSHTFSPLLKKYIALATLERPYAVPGAQVQVEVTVEYTRQQATAIVVDLPFLNPPRKRA